MVIILINILMPICSEWRRRGWKKQFVGCRPWIFLTGNLWWSFWWWWWRSWWQALKIPYGPWWWWWWRWRGWWWSSSSLSKHFCLATPAAFPGHPALALDIHHRGNSTQVWNRSLPTFKNWIKSLSNLISIETSIHYPWRPLSTLHHRGTSTQLQITFHYSILDENIIMIVNCNLINKNILLWNVCMNVNFNIIWTLFSESK